MKYILKPALTLFIAALIVVAALSIVYNKTYEPIQRQKSKTLEAALKKVMPQANKYSEIQIEKTGSITAVYQAFADNEWIGFVFKLAPEGYSGKIDLLVGFSVPGSIITGLRVIRHTETPGFGSNAVKEKFYKQYDYLPLSPLKVVRSNPGPGDIQAITSATITTKAITNAVNEAINWYHENVSERIVIEVVE